MIDNEIFDLELKEYLSCFLEINEEYNFEVTIEGVLPEEINGDFLQIGPRGANSVGEAVHWFDGDGLISAWHLREGKAFFKNRFVKTEQILDEERSNRRKYRGYFTNLKNGWLGNFGKKHKNPINAWIVELPDQSLLGGSGFGIPLQIDSDTLKISENQSFLERIPKKWQTWITEPLFHKQNESMYVITGHFMDKKLRPAIEIVEVPLKGEVKRVARLNLGDFYLTHSFALTENFAVLPVAPYRTGLNRAIASLTGKYPMTEAPLWRPDEALSFYIVDLEGKKPVRCLKTKAEFPLHVVNAFEQNNDVIIDCEVYPDGKLPLDEVEASNNDIELHENPPGGTLIRYVLKDNSTVERIVLSSKKVALPFANEEFIGESSTPLYAISLPSWISSGLLKIDPDNKITESGIDSLKYVGGGPEIINTPNGKSWIFCPVYTGGKKSISELHIYSCHTFELQCKLKIPIGIPLSTHSLYVEK